jgi:soluble cytochrome b562
MSAPIMTKSEGAKLLASGAKLQAENEQLRAELTKVTARLDAALEVNLHLSAQMKDLQEKLDIIINQFNKQNKKQYGSKNEHHNPRQASSTPNNNSEQPSSNGGATPAPVKKLSRKP